jgi:hypothetical protein
LFVYFTTSRIATSLLSFLQLVPTPIMFRNIESQKRSHESPMDWEWQTQGPTDPKSPFPQFKPQQGRKSELKMGKGKNQE